jgi:hypothetical protein
MSGSHPARPAKPEPVTQPAEAAQVNLAVAETPNGQRLILQLTMQLDPAQAKELAAAISQAAAGMTSSRLLTGTLILPGGNGGPR